MNILEKIEKIRTQYEELHTLPDCIETYLAGYDIDNKSVDEMLKEFFHVFGKYDITNKDFICIAESLGYVHTRTCVEGKRFYTLVKMR